MGYGLVICDNWCEEFGKAISSVANERYIAAVKQLKKLAEENWEEGKIIEKAKADRDITSRNVTHNTERMA